MYRSLLRLCACLSLVLPLAAAAAATPAAPAGQDPAPGQVLRPLQGHDLYQQTLQGTAFVQTPVGTTGTGWVLDKDARLLITSCHVVADLRGGVVQSVQVVFPVTADGQLIAERSYYNSHFNELAVNGFVVNGIVLHSDPQRDLALIQLDALPDNVRALPLAPRGVQPGDTVFSVGNPAGSSALWLFNSGTVRQVYHAETTLQPTGQRVSARVVETQDPLNPGDSGGPLVNKEGQVVGVNMSVNQSSTLVTDDIDLSELYAYLAEVRPVASPRTAAEFAARGDLFRGSRRYDRAVADYSAALRLDPKLVQAYSRRAWVYNRLSKFDLALADCDQALALDPRDASALAERACAHHNKGADELALADANAALAVGPDNADALVYRAQAEAGLGDDDGAIADCSRVIGLKGEAAPAEVFYQRGLARAGKGDRAGAIADYTEAIKRAQDYAEVLEARGDAYRADGRDALAKGDYRRALVSAPDGSDLEARVLQKLTQVVARLKDEAPAAKG